jgi:protein gp37
MATKSAIEWTENTWNPVTGCTKISPGCKFCYAERMAFRLQAMGVENYRNGFEVTLHEHMLQIPLKWKKPAVVFVNSMSDLFHDKIPDQFILKVFEVMNQAHWHQFQVLTKRPERVLKMNSLLPWSPNIWMGTSVESEKYAFRIDFLRKVNAHIKFLSLEPLLGPLDSLDLEGVDWAIVGGESGHRARPMKEEWVISIRDQCQEAGIPFFFKQWGGTNKKKTGRLLEGRTWDDTPCHSSTKNEHLLMW